MPRTGRAVNKIRTATKRAILALYMAGILSVNATQRLITLFGVEDA